MSVINRISNAQVHELKLELAKQIANLLRTDKPNLIYHICEQVDSTTALIKSLTEGAE